MYIFVSGELLDDMSFLSGPKFNVIIIVIIIIDKSANSSAISSRELS